MRSIRTSVLASLCLVVTGGLIWSQDVAGLPPKDHAIWTNQELVPPGHAAFATESMAIIRSGRLSFEFKLHGKSFLLGAPITGTVTLKNVTDKTTFFMSPPYVGCNVATLGVWRSQWIGTGGADGKWGPLEQSCPVNGGPIRQSKAYQRQGKPLHLKPGETYTASFPINVIQHAGLASEGEGGSRACWFSGVGFSKPGRYRFYLKYVNLEERIPYASRLGKESASSRKQKIAEGEVQSIPMYPILLGPYEVEVLEPEEGEGTEAIVEMYAKWGKQFPKRSHYLFESVNEDALAAMLGTTPEGKNFAFRHSMILSAVRSRLNSIHPRLAERDLYLGRLLGQAHVLSAYHGAGVIRDAARLTECYILDELGKTDEALALAKIIETPDAVVFIEELKAQLAERAKPK